MRSDLNPEDRHEAGYRWACEFESETGIHNLTGFRWNLDSGITGCDTAWMLAYLCPRTRRSARSVVLRAVAGLKTRPGVHLVTHVADNDKDAAREAIRD